MTWGDGRSGPYISGVPIGTVAKVYASLTNSLRSAVVVPYVDFSALDEVGVAVPVGTRTIGDVFRADGKVGP
jgi:rod shape-determining protein MreC